MSKNVVGVFMDRNNAEQAVHTLLQNQIDQDRISIIAGDRQGTAEQASVVGEGATAAGAFVGGSFALLTGLTTIALPGVGLALAAGPLAATLGVAASAAEDNPENDRLQRLLVSAGFMEEQASAYAEDVRRGNTLVGVHAEDDQSDLVGDVFRRFGGVKLDFRRRGNLS